MLAEHVEHDRPGRRRLLGERVGGQQFPRRLSGCLVAGGVDLGERLAFGSTTGGLWVSEDQGDSWACVTHTLPPVYAVRFG